MPLSVPAAIHAMAYATPSKRRMTHWVAHTNTESTGHTSTVYSKSVSESPVFGSDMSPIPHGLPDVSDCAHSEPKSPPKAGQGTSDDEVLIGDDEASSKRPYMPFNNDLCELSDHDSDEEAPSGAHGQRVEPECRSGPSREAKHARVDLSIKDAQRSLSNESIAKFHRYRKNSLPTNATVGRIAPRSLLAVTLCDGVRLRMISVDMGEWQTTHWGCWMQLKIANPNTRKDLQLKNNSKVFAHKLDDLAVCQEVF